MKAQKERGIETGFYIAGLCLSAAAFVYYVIYKITGFRVERYLYPCIFHALTGYYCPGCGGTRAVYALFQGELRKSFLCQPFVLYTVAVGGWFLVSQTIERLSKGRIALGMRYRDSYLWLALMILAINFLVKNLALLVFHVDLLSL